MSYYCKNCPRIIEEDDEDLCPECKASQMMVDNNNGHNSGLPHQLNENCSVWGCRPQEIKDKNREWRGLRGEWFRHPQDVKEKNILKRFWGWLKWFLTPQPPTGKCECCYEREAVRWNCNHDKRCQKCYEDEGYPIGE